MRRPLIRHPAAPCDAVGAIEVEAARRSGGVLSLRYVATGVSGSLVLPPPAAGRADELWRRTCFEGFVQAAGQGPYRELNLSPSGQWAAYAFHGYRAGQADAAVAAPETRIVRGEGALELEVVWRLDLPDETMWRLAMSAVVEEAGGGLSYWALRHPAGRPDFHHADGFALELPPPSGP